MGLVAPQHVGSSWTRARTRVPCIGRRILNHCTTREALGLPPIFGLGCLFFLIWSFMSCLYILEINPLSVASWVALSITVTYSWGKEKKTTQQIHPHASCFSKILLPWRIWLLIFFSYFSEFSCSLFWILSKIYSWNQEEEWTIGDLHHYSRSKTLMSYLLNFCHVCTSVSVLARDFIYFCFFFLMRLARYLLFY